VNAVFDVILILSSRDFNYSKPFVTRFDCTTATRPREANTHDKVISSLARKGMVKLVWTTAEIRGGMVFARRATRSCTSATSRTI